VLGFLGVLGERGARIGLLVLGVGWHRRSRPLTRIPHLAVQAEPGSSSPHPAATAEGDELAGLRGQSASARQLKLEGAESVGHQAIIIGRVREPYILRQPQAIVVKSELS
jgi:hypothetical protein